MIEKIGSRLSAWAQRWVPDPFIFAVVLTLVAFGLVMGMTDASLGAALEGWGKGFWELLAFAMQMCLVLVTGHALATSGPVRRLINGLAGVPRSGPAAAALVATAASVCGLLNWGLGLVVGALMARAVALRGQAEGRAFHYPLLAAAGYTGMLVWHGGLSGTAPLVVATEGHFLQARIGLVPIAQTLFSPLNVVVVLGLLVVIPALCAGLHPRVGIRTVADFGVADESTSRAEGHRAMSPARRLEASRIFSMLGGVFGTGFMIRKVLLEGFQPDLNLINMIFLSLGLLLHRNLSEYLAAVVDGAKSCAGIILQFPFYGGIMGVMKYTGLMTAMATSATEHVGPVLYPVVTFLSAGIVNLFVPSGGGQWAVQGPIAVEAAGILGISVPKTVMAVAYGDQWTNMFQPFWALALLGITRLRAGDIMGYTIVFMGVSMPVFVGALLLIPA